MVADQGPEVPPIFVFPIANVDGVNGVVEHVQVGCIEALMLEDEAEFLGFVKGCFEVVVEQAG